MFSQLARSFLSWFVFAASLPLRTITRDDGQPYLLRWYLCGEVGGLKYFEDGQREPRWWQKALRWLPCIYVHRFVSSDLDPELHNHPWEAVSLIVSGGYVEERRLESRNLFEIVGGARVTSKIVTRTFAPGAVNYLFADTFHRVTLVESDCWTLIKLGKKVQSWGFWCPLTERFLPWREHVALKTVRKITARGGRA